MTEDEAKTKWCPKTKKSGEMINMKFIPDIACCCIASQCVWWVWDEYEDVGDKMVPSLPIGGHCGVIKCP